MKHGVSAKKTKNARKSRKEPRKKKNKNRNKTKKMRRNKAYFDGGGEETEDEVVIRLIKNAEIKYNTTVDRESVKSALKLFQESSIEKSSTDENQMGGLHVFDDSIGYCKAYSIARVMYKLFKHKDIMLVSDPSKGLYSNEIKQIIEETNKRRADLDLPELDYHDITKAFKNFNKKRQDDSHLSFHTHQLIQTDLADFLKKYDKKKVHLAFLNEPEYVAEQIYFEQLKCFYGIFPIIVYIYYFLGVREFIGINNKFQFTSRLLNKEKMNEYFTVEKKNIILNSKFDDIRNFENFNVGFKKPKIKPTVVKQDDSDDIGDFVITDEELAEGIEDMEYSEDIEDSVHLDNQLKTFYELMSNLKEQLVAANLIPVELRVFPNPNPNPKEGNFFFNVLPSFPIDEPVYIHLSCFGKFKTIFENSAESQKTTGHAVAVSKLDEKGITLKNSWGEEYENDGSRFVEWDVIEKLGVNNGNDYLQLNVILLIPT
uniref:Uncharacterized protein n=1 Tax=viral metagenome TaxID=1070528 RepID=A0A6C0HJR5_9ZZZZ